MGRDPEYQFIPTGTEELTVLLTAAYEQITGSVVRPAVPEQLFIRWVAHVIIQKRVLTNYAGNQNVPSRAEGSNMDALAELSYAHRRPQARAAGCTMRFTISGPQTFAVLLPGGTRVTDNSGALIWETTEDIYVKPGETWVDVETRCQTPGMAGNGYVSGRSIPSWTRPPLR